MAKLWSRVAAAARWRRRAAVAAARQFPTRVGAWVACQTRLSRYRRLSEPALRATRTSDVVFVFGSGASLNALTAADWRAIGAHDTIGFNWFVHERFVRCDYHLVREICTTISTGGSGGLSWRNSGGWCAATRIMRTRFSSCSAASARRMRTARSVSSCCRATPGSFGGAACTAGATRRSRSPQDWFMRRRR